MTFTESPATSPSGVSTPASTPSPRSGDAGLNLPTRHKASLSGLDDYNRPRERRKRSRVSPEQLVQLERIFAGDRSPTAAQRKEISVLLGMSERQTQVWFQNRRAKAKLSARSNRDKGASIDASVDVPPDDYDHADLRNRIHEEGPFDVVPCTDLTIGTWRRIAAAVDKHDLLTYICEQKRCMTWFVHCAGVGFKMEVPFDDVIEATVTHIAPAICLASFTLSSPPKFFLKSETDSEHWKRCSDWTEGCQATKVLRHDITGSEAHWTTVVQRLSLDGRNGEISLRPPPPQFPDPSIAALSPAFRQGNELPEPMRKDYPPQGRPSSEAPSYYPSHDPPARNSSRLVSPSSRDIEPLMKSQEIPPSQSQRDTRHGWSTGAVLSRYCAQASEPGGNRQIPALAYIPSEHYWRYHDVVARSTSPYGLSNSREPPSSASTSSAYPSLDGRTLSPPQNSSLLSPLLLQTTAGGNPSNLQGQLAGVPAISPSDRPEFESGRYL